MSESKVVVITGASSGIEARAGMQAAYDALAIPAESVAESIAFAINMPENTGINEIIIRPTAQQL